MENEERFCCSSKNFYCTATGPMMTWRLNIPVKRVLLSFFCLMFIASWAYPSHAQTSPYDYLQEMQKEDPGAAADLSRALKRGDFQKAQKLYDEFKKKQQQAKKIDPVVMEELNRAIAQEDFDKAQNILDDLQKKQEGIIPAIAEEPEGPSLFERTLAGDFPADVSVTLTQFGYDTFKKAVATFTPLATVPVGPDYIIGPGDQFTLTLWGTTEGIYTVTVSREGNITLPKVGVVPVAGLRFGKLERTLRRHLAKHYSRFSLSVAMGELKTITVYVVGEVTNPGSYSVNSLTSTYGALFAAGGPTKKGTMRNIQVLRRGKVIKTIDLYDFLLRGDRRQDIKLQHEDTVFVPLIGPVAGVTGTVYRPAIYELKSGETIGNLIETAGGIMPIALASRLQLYRFSDNQKKVILDIQLTKASAVTPKKAPELRQTAKNMDLISILPIYPKIWETVNVDGHVRHPGDFEWRTDLRLKDIVLKSQLLPTSDLRNAEVIRLTDDYMDREIIPVNLEALMKGDEKQNIVLRPKDQIRVYTTFRDVETIVVSGEILRPGAYEINKGERLSDLLRRVGGFTDESYVYGTVFKRRNIQETQQKNVQKFIMKLQAQVLQAGAEGTATAISAEEAALARSELALNQNLLNTMKTMVTQFEGRVAINITEDIDSWKGSKDDLLLQDGDSLHIPKRPQEVLVMGEVYSPGAQIFLPDMKVKDYIARAGGYGKYAEKDQVFVVQANGFAFGVDSPAIGDIEDVKLKAGDAIFVPQKVERYAGMRFTKDVIDILFKTAVIIATITVLF